MLRSTGRKPPRTLAEALRNAQRQASKLLLLTHQYEAPVDVAILAADPKIELVYTGRFRKVSGACRWIGNRYVIAINRKESEARQRFTAFHELKHAIDGAAITSAVTRLSRPGKRPAEEYVADFFAGCVLMPEPWLVAAIPHARDLDHLASYFRVSREAMRVRLETLGLDRALSRGRV
jgi:Zn-dependent peptidase ImmA (M78 family)